MVYKQTTPIDLIADAQSGAMSDHLVRLERLTALRDERGWSDSDLARHARRTPQQIRSWRDPKGRKIGERLARSLEEQLNLPRYYLDERPAKPASLEVREGVINTYKPAQARMLTPHGGTQVPITKWDRLATMTWDDQDRSELRHAGTLESFADVTIAARFVEMPDDSMAPEFGAGDHILFEPAEAPRAGDTVLIRIGSGEHFVRRFKPRTAQDWTAEPLNSHYAALSSLSDKATVIAVMVEHRRYRRRP